MVAMVGALALATSASARTPAEIQAVVDAATRDFKEGRYAEALATYTSVQKETHDLRLLYMIGRCHEELGSVREAVSAYEEFLVGDAPQAIRERALGRTRELRALLDKGTLHVVVRPDDAEVRVDGALVGTGPRLDAEVGSGARLVEVTAAGHEAHRETVTVPEAGEATVEVSLAVQQAVASDPTIGAAGEQPMDELEAWAWGVGSTGLALVVGGAVTLALGEADHQELVGTPGYGTPVVQTTRANALLLESRGDTLKTTGFALLGVGGTAIVTSAVLFVVDASEPAAVSVFGGPIDGGAGCFVRGSF
jgi:hypothetical protein